MNINKLIDSHSDFWRIDSFLSRLRRDTLDRLATVGRLVEFRAGDTLITEGDDDTAVLLLLSSFVKITAALDGTGDALLALRFGGDVVGEMAAVDHGKRSATVRACGRAPVIAVSIDRGDFLSTLRPDPEAMLTLTATISSKLRSANQRRIDFTGCSTPVRLAKVLLELASTHGDSSNGATVIGVDLTQIEVGTLVGVKQATAERGLRKLRSSGLVDTSGRRFIVRDLEALRRLANHGPVGVPIV
ncbi:cAMP-binding domain of CRP or a regulatory subunit of cAMP-dependent protein kinases [Amycolatopsis marina]|uniref:cAMP-binding domain of CRP or a regulatory subunit of cAMP-dependent protein kinases n=1 Tax=Amycolatopsis marina TaxID=490629 RepID=A0A1I1C8Q1_9PSEU|nr:Crp/Fnr family transcriptional regulator [Amycolatopsis marina]SFB59075.1 cAMP-binding domain of CRP or a regulatory subunit of cAMP-dependent protein kinases [Amycolatopsis marina]